ncbi:hypothetical protein [Bacillus wiedmannii]|uniref:hypothetical protein n=1 Tax=Bacillus wiedmannii TaxID=1890302 RepID=UPI0020CC4699|nr:hypothetical protein [Bacillus wiedmannii]MCP9280132.1 hypothetical protein [Bacillus wiedmannii]
MRIRQHGQHITIDCDEDILQRAEEYAGYKIEATDERYKDTKVSLEDLKWLYNQAWRTRRKDHAVLYAIAQVNYIAENDFGDE